MSNPFVYYRIESLNNLKRDPSCSVKGLDRHADLTLIRRFYARFSSNPVNPDVFDPYVGNPPAVIVLTTEKTIFPCGRIPKRSA